MVRVVGNSGEEGWGTVGAAGDGLSSSFCSCGGAEVVRPSGAVALAVVQECGTYALDGQRQRAGLAHRVGEARGTIYAVRVAQLDAGYQNVENVPRIDAGQVVRRDAAPACECAHALDDREL